MQHGDRYCFRPPNFSIVYTSYNTKLGINDARRHPRHGNMNRRRSTAPLLEPEPSELERLDPGPSSPAQNALQSNLDSIPTFKKKESWFSIRGSIQKGASTIKGAIDSLRGDQSTVEDDGSVLSI